MTKSAKELTIFAEGIRLLTLQTIGKVGSGHVGGSMSIAETLAVLYGGEMRCDPKNPAWEERDRLVISKGHAGPALYSALALRGYFPLEMLDELNQDKGRLPSHCDMNKTPGVDMTTGSLGQGISSAIGIALGCKLNKLDSRVYLILGDGECNEGQIWEGVMFANHHKIDNLIAFVDYNKQQLDGYTKDVMDLGDIGAKFEAFGWYTQTVNGHSIPEVLRAVRNAKNHDGGPRAIILNTIKGYGATFAEGKEKNHHMSFGAKELAEALESAAGRLEAAKAMREQE
jgi:transketolase